MFAEPETSAAEPKRSALDRAQDLICDAWEARGRARIALARKALEISPDCADAYVLLAENTGSLKRALELYAAGMEAGERAIGQSTFKTDVGHFWGLLETRPYMRARAGFARCLWATERRKEAIEHYRDMLRLNPNDNQGLRYLLAACLIELGCDEELADLLDAYEDDATAEWAYARFLLVFRKHGDSDESRRALADALETNPHAPIYLFGLEKLPRRLPDCVGFGDESEAVSYVANNLGGWMVNEDALEWLVRQLEASQP